MARGWYLTRATLVEGERSHHRQSMFPKCFVHVTFIYFPKGSDNFNIGQQKVFENKGV